MAVGVPTFHPRPSGRLSGRWGAWSGFAPSRCRRRRPRLTSRGGRPDLAADVLPDVRAPTLLIVGGEDRPVIGMNESALAALGAPKQMEIVSRATHLFEEPGTLALSKLRARKTRSGRSPGADRLRGSHLCEQ